MPPHRQTYQDVTFWRGYERFYPPSLRHGDDDPVEQWWRWRDVDVHLDRFPAPDAEATLVLLHGAGGYGRMLAPYARLLRRAESVEVVAPDLPGYGLTRTDTAVSYPDWLDCVTDLVAAERSRAHRPVFLLGASMGGMLAYQAAARGGVAGLVVTCLLDPGRPEVRARMTRMPVVGRLGPTVMPRLRRLDRLPVPMGMVANMAAMSNEPALTALVRADRCGGGNRVPLRFLRTFLTGAPPMEPERFTVCPVLMVHPGADRWTPPEFSVPFFERIAADTELVILDRAGHLPIEEPGLTRLGQATGDFVRRHRQG
ncbi:alpha/beta hydrolase [Micromonospora sp. SH-82]|uniref:alpha/beta hydrolase n=1 Tax=Micromonospora sp. SH-82 TaxID=3132938 RepID=UPI003EB6D3AE